MHAETPYEFQERMRCWANGLRHSHGELRVRELNYLIDHFRNDGASKDTETLGSMCDEAISMLRLLEFDKSGGLLAHKGRCYFCHTQKPNHVEGCRMAAILGRGRGNRE
jgi:hypothetical protein